MLHFSKTSRNKNITSSFDCGLQKNCGPRSSSSTHRISVVTG